MKPTYSIFPFSLFFSECDIEYISPADYQPPAESGGGGNGTSNGFDDDPYDRLVKGNLKKIEEQKARYSTFFSFTKCGKAISFAKCQKLSENGNIFFLQSLFPSC